MARGGTWNRGSNRFRTVERVSTPIPLIRTVSPDFFFQLCILIYLIHFMLGFQLFQIKLGKIMAEKEVEQEVEQVCTTK